MKAYFDYSSGSLSHVHDVIEHAHGCCTGRASTGESNEGVGDGRVNGSVGIDPLAKKASWTGPGLQTGEEGATGSDSKAGSSTAVQAEVEARRNEDEKWLSMTTTEKRRLWLERRRSGEFYFRSEFKGLVHAVGTCALEALE